MRSLARNGFDLLGNALSGPVWSCWAKQRNGWLGKAWVVSGLRSGAMCGDALCRMMTQCREGSSTAKRRPVEQSGARVVQSLLGDVGLGGGYALCRMVTHRGERIRRGEACQGITRAPFGDVQLGNVWFSPVLYSTASSSTARVFSMTLFQLDGVIPYGPQGVC